MDLKGWLSKALFVVALSGVAFFCLSMSRVAVWVPAPYPVAYEIRGHQNGQEASMFMAFFPNRQILTVSEYDGVKEAQFGIARGSIGARAWFGLPLWRTAEHGLLGWYWGIDGFKPTEIEYDALHNIGGRPSGDLPSIGRHYYLWNFSEDGNELILDGRMALKRIAAKTTKLEEMRQAMLDNYREITGKEAPEYGSYTPSTRANP